MQVKQIERDVEKGGVFIPRQAISIVNLRMAADVLSDTMPETAELVQELADVCASLYYSDKEL